MNFKWHKISLFFFFTIALIGALMRSTFISELPVTYAHLLHAHSHVAFQGWIYTLFFLLIVKLYLTAEMIERGYYRLQFQITVVIVLCILISFSLQGYGLYSIIFSTLFQCLIFWFIFQFFKDTKPNDDSISLRFIKIGFIFGLLSALIPFGLPVLIAKGLKESDLYQSLLYAFLHLQYNGWFLLVVIGFFYKILEKNAFEFDKQNAFKFYTYFSLAVLPAIAMSLLNNNDSIIISITAYAATILQIIGIIFFTKHFNRPFKLWLEKQSDWFRIYILLFLISFLLKVIVQSLSVIPALEDLVFENRDIVIAYLHLSLIAIVSFLLLAVLIELNWLKTNTLNSIAHTLLITGFVLTNTLLLLRGLELFSNHIAIFASSTMMAIGILLLLIDRQKSPTANQRS